MWYTWTEGWWWTWYTWTEGGGMDVYLDRGVAVDVVYLDREGWRWMWYTWTEGWLMGVVYLDRGGAMGVVYLDRGVAMGVYTWTEQVAMGVVYLDTGGGGCGWDILGQRGGWMWYTWTAGVGIRGILGFCIVCEKLLTYGMWCV
ncbi:unnamed protein product [Staurois parvus]|uniref:Uncharacterized protein n=1 Tax=Staurois parvus TaxID=386267 RepID=A0ABN9FY77_9NEOB|nr:unnamed protein product [Staurois parvus]